MASTGKLKFQEPQRHVNKVLPEGIHHITEDEFHDFFCVNFPASETRPDIDAGYTEFRQVLTAIIPSRHWVDGSFVEDKINPNDVDVIVWVDSRQFIALSKANHDFLFGIFNDPIKSCKYIYRTHAFLEPIFHPGDGQYGYYKSRLDYWRRWLSTTASGDSKGMISLGLNMPYSAAPNVPDPWLEG